MKKKYVSAVVFSAMMLAAGPVFVSCSDYDDDIDSLQEQVDGIKTGYVLPEDLSKAVDAAKAELQGKLDDLAQLKGDASAIQDLQSDVDQLMAALAGQGDASNIEQQLNEIKAKIAKIDQMESDISGLTGELDTKIADLEKKLENAASADKTELQGMISDLEADLQQQIDQALTAEDLKSLNDRISALEGAECEGVDEATVRSIVSEELAKALTDSSNELKQIKDMATKGGQFAADFAAQFASLDALKATIDDYETRLGQLESATMPDTIVGKNMLAQALAQVSATLESTCDGKYLKQSELDGKIANYLSTELGIDEDKMQSVDDLLAMKTNVLDDLFAGVTADTKSYTELLQEVSAIQTKFEKDGDFAKLQASVTGLEKKYDELVADVKAMIQSIVYMPEYVDGMVKFQSLYFTKDSKVTEISKSQNQTVRFRVSPVAALAEYADFKQLCDSFDIVVDGQEIKQRAISSNESLVKVIGGELDKTNGIITLTVSQGSEIGNVESKDRYASLNLHMIRKASGAEDGVRTDILSDYFTLGVEGLTIKSVKVKTNASVADFVYNEASTIDFKAGRTFVGVTADDSEVSLASFDMEQFGKVTYELTDDSDKDYFSLADGVLSMKKVNDPLAIGKKASVKYTYTFNKDVVAEEPSFSETYSKDVTIQKYVENLPYDVNAEFNGGNPFAVKWSWTAQADENEKKYVDANGNVVINLNMTKIAQDLKVTQSELNTLLSNSSNITSTPVLLKGTLDVIAEIKNVNNQLQLVINRNSNMAKANGTTVTYVIQNGDLQKMTITAKLAAATTYPVLDITLNDNQVKDNKTTFVVNKNVDAAGKLQSIAFNKINVKGLFLNVEKTQEAAEDADGTFTIAANVKFTKGNEGSTFITATGNELSIPNVADFDITKVEEISATGTIDFDATSELDGAEEKITVAIPSLGGSWSNAGNTLTIDENNPTINVGVGCTWTDMYGNVMWKDGAAVTGDADAEEGSPALAYADNVKALSIFGLDAPSYAVPDFGNYANYFEFNQTTGELKLTKAATDYVRQTDITLTFKVNVDVTKGAVNGLTDATRTIKVVLPANAQ